MTASYPNARRAGRGAGSCRVKADGRGQAGRRRNVLGRRRRQLVVAVVVARAALVLAILLLRCPRASSSWARPARGAIGGVVGGRGDRAARRRIGGRLSFVDGPRSASCPPCPAPTRGYLTNVQACIYAYTYTYEAAGPAPALVLTRPNGPLSRRHERPSREPTQRAGACGCLIGPAPRALHGAWLLTLAGRFGQGFSVDEPRRAGADAGARRAASRASRIAHHATTQPRNHAAAQPRSRRPRMTPHPASRRRTTRSLTRALQGPPSTTRRTSAYALLFLPLGARPPRRGEGE